jgi:hypothetical protein
MFRVLGREVSPGTTLDEAERSHWSDPATARRVLYSLRS